MADGSQRLDVESADIAQVKESRPISRFFRWLFFTRQGLLSIWIAVAGSALSAAVGANFIGPYTGYLNDSFAMVALIGSGSLLLLPVLLLFLDPPDNYQKGPKPFLPQLCLGVLGVLTLLVLWDMAISDASVLGANRQPDTAAQLAARLSFFAFLAVAFIPLIWNAANFARFERDRRQQIAEATKAAAGEDDPADQHEENTEAMGALLATILVCFVSALAIIAGAYSDTASVENTYGLVLCGVVIAVFVAVVFLDVIAESDFVQMLSRTLRDLSQRVRFLAAFYNWVDTGLVRIGASVAGVGQDSVAVRYTLLAGTLGCFSALAWFLPPPLGLVPAFAGFVLAISVSRIWAWVEEDRALASMTEYKHDAPYRIGFREDFRDEALLGFAFVFLLAPMAMMQAHEGHFFGPALFVVPADTNFLTWFGFFGVELAKAVPIVDWAEIYEIQATGDVIQFKSAAARHSVFLARVMVDLVLIASLLQAIGITTRNRHQKRLLSAGHIRRLDAFVERNEIARAIRATRRNHMGRISKDLKGEAAAVMFNLTKLGRDGVVDFRRYDRDRLFHVYGATEGHLEQRAFIAAIAHQAGWELEYAIELTQRIADTDKNEPAMYAAFQRALGEHRQGVRVIDAGDVFVILTHLRSIAGLRDFKFLLIKTMTEVASPEEIIEKLTGLAVGGKTDRFLYTRNRIAAVIAETAPHVSEVAVLEDALREWSAASDKDQRPSPQDHANAVEALQRAVAAFSAG